MNLASGRASRALTWLVAGSLVLAAGTARACVGAACLRIWSTADGGGSLSVQWDPAKKVQTYASFCAPDNSQCLYSTIDPGFMAPTQDDDPTDSYYVLRDTTKVRVVIVAADAGLSVNVNGQKLYQPGDNALLGTMPTIHNHPSWQIVVPGDRFGDFNVSYQLATDSPLYAESDVLGLIVTNVPPPEGTATPTPLPTPTPTPCAGDCTGDGMVTIDELVMCVNMALGGQGEAACPHCDPNADGGVTIDEVIAAVNAALNGCPMPAPVSFGEIQDTIFTPSCAIQGCHDPLSQTGNLILTPGTSYDQLVKVEPDTFAARNAGLLRVQPGDPEQSFLLTKITGPPPDEGSRMPLTGDPLSDQQIQLIRDWILQGALPGG